MDTKDKLAITQYTDPMCIWCYALEPALRKIEVQLGERVEFHNVLGLLVSDAKEIVGEGELAALRFEQLRQQMTSHFLDAAQKSGMPVSVAHMETCRPEDVTSVPMSLAYEAMALLDEHEANRYLRRMREAAHAEDRGLSNTEVLVELAREFDVDHEAFVANLKGGAAARALEADVRRCAERGVRAFPTMTVAYGGREIMVQSFREHAELRAIIDELTGGAIRLEEVPYTLEAAAGYVNRFGKVAARELQVMFDLSDDALDACVEGLVDSGLFEREDRGTSYFVKTRALMACDPATGVCSLA